MTYTAPTLVNGTPYPAATWQAALDEVARLSAASVPTWTSYGTSTTILTAVTTNPTMGTTAWAAHYRTGTGVVDVRMYFTIAAGFSAGSGAYRFLLPSAASAAAVLAATGSAFMDDFGTALRTGVVIMVDTTHVEIYRDSATASIGSGGPGSAWSNGDRIKLSFSYEPA